MNAPVADTGQSSRLSLPALALLLLVLTAIKLFVAGHAGLAFDEGYYTFWSERLQPGYLDHPPVVAVLIAAGRALLGDNELGVRLFSILSGLVLSGLLWRMGFVLLGRRAATLAVILYNTAPVAALGIIATPDPPSTLFWTAALWAVAEFVASRRPAWWLVAGVMAGLGLWSKYTVAFLAPGLLLYLLVSAERRQWLHLWQVWAGGLLALIVFSPVIWWNWRHGWASFTFQGRRTVVAALDSNVLGNFGDFLLAQALYMAPVLFVATIIGAIACLAQRGRGVRGLELPVWTSLPALAYFVFHTLHALVDGNWLMPLWPPLTLAAAWALLALFDRRGAWAKAALCLQLALGIVPMLAFYIQAVWQPWNLGAPDRTSETRGWRPLEQQLGQLAASNGARWIATSGNYGVTGELAAYALFAGSPYPVRQVDEPARWWFLPPLAPDIAAAPALFVRPEPNPDNPALPTGAFGAAKLLSVLPRDDTGTPPEAWSVFLVDKPSAEVISRLVGSH
ncbi:MAG TPA: glycosyltransferase family 39 protein [Devosia sp.]|nr:glycosyltransferase family 39 protein [Devosia sp.]